MSELDLSRYEGHTPGPWKLWTSNSWRRICAVLTTVCEPIVQRSDNHPDLYFRNGGENGPDAHLLEDAPLLLAEVERLREDAERWRKLMDMIDEGAVYIQRGHGAATPAIITARIDAARKETP